MALTRSIQRYDCRGRLPGTAGSGTAAAAASLRSGAARHQRRDHVKQAGAIRSGVSATLPIVKNENQGSWRRASKESSTLPSSASSYRLPDVEMMLDLNCLSLPPAVHCGVFHHSGNHKNLYGNFDHVSIINIFGCYKNSQVRFYPCRQALFKTHTHTQTHTLKKRATTFKFEILTF